MFFEHNQKPEVSLEDAEETSNHIKAITPSNKAVTDQKHGLKRLKEGFPLSIS